MISIFLFMAFNGHAMDTASLVREIHRSSLSVEAIGYEKEELLALNELSLSSYGWGVNFSGTSLRDKSVQDSPASPSDLDNKSFSLGVSKKWSLGLTSSIGVSNDAVSYTGINFATFNATRYERNKSALYASIGLDLSQNISGRIDRVLIDNHFDQKDIVKMSSSEKLDAYLLMGIRSYYGLVLSVESSKLYKEMVASAKDLLVKSEKRRRGGIVDDRALLIYRSNLSTAQKGEIFSLNNLHLASSSFDNYIYRFDYERDLSAAEIVSDKEKQLLKRFENVDVAKLVKGMRKTRLQMRSLDVERRKRDQYSYQRLPLINLNLTVTGMGNKEELGESFNQASGLDRPQYLIGLTMSYPISGNAACSSFKAQSSRVKREELKFREDLRSRESLLRNSLSNLRNLYRLVDVAKYHQKNEKRKYVNELKEYKRGRSSARDVVQFQNEYLNSRLSRVQAIVDFKMALNTILMDLGELSQFYGLGEK